MRGIDDTMDGNAVDEKPEEQPQGGDDEQGQIGVDAQQAEEEIGGEHAQRHHRPVAEVDDPHHPPDQAQPHGRHAVHKAEEQSIDERGEELPHEAVLLPASPRRPAEGGGRGPGGAVSPE